MGGIRDRPVKWNQLDSERCISHFLSYVEHGTNKQTRVTRAQTAWEDADEVSFTVLQYSHRQPWARAA
jgi:hypothetical protein